MRAKMCSKWTPERRRAQSERAKRQWADAEFRAHVSKTQSERAKRQWRDPKYRRRVVNGIKAAMATNDVRRRLAERASRGDFPPALLRILESRASRLEDEVPA